MSETLPLLDVLRGAENYLAARGVENARLNAEHLLAHTLGIRRMELYLQFDRALGESERAPLREMVRRRGTREPLQHILGTVGFHGRTFACDKRALIPRHETEQLVEIVIEIAKAKSGASTMLDVGTGSGIIALTLALELPNAVIHATDTSCDALALAAENATRHGLAGRITFHQADLLPPDNSQFDLIVANLPYIPACDIAGLAEEVRHDPPSALDGGPDGLGIIRRLIEATPDRLTPGGALLLEIGTGQSDAVATMMEERKFRDISIRRDYQDIPRFAAGFHG